MDNKSRGTRGEGDQEAQPEADRASPMHTSRSPMLGRRMRQGGDQTSKEALEGEKGSVLIDRVAERLAYERLSTRLYEGLLTKLDARGSFPGGPTRGELTQFHGEEREHLAMLQQCLEALGADPAAMTPSADVTGVESNGVMNIVRDPRTTLAQSLHALLVAELVDREGWEMLADLAEQSRHGNMAVRFRRAQRAEEEHLDAVRRWVSGFSLLALEGEAPRPDRF